MVSRAHPAGEREGGYPWAMNATSMERRPGGQEPGTYARADPQACGLGVLCRPVSSSGAQGARGRPSRPSRSDPLAPCLSGSFPSRDPGEFPEKQLLLSQELGADLLKE